MFWRNEDDPGVVAQRRPTVDVVVPVFNEERALPGCVEVLSRYLAGRIPLDATIA